MFRTIAAVLWKDVKIELRTKEALSAAFVFGVIVLVIFNFTLELSSEEAKRLGPGFLWVAFAFGGILALNRSFSLEKDEECTRGLMLSPADRGGIYAGKFLANVIFMLVVEILILPLFIIFYDVRVGTSVPLLLLIFFLGSVGFSAVGTLFSAVAANTRMREVMLPVLLLPITVPALIASVETTAFALGASVEASFWFTLLVVYDVVFVTVAFLIFDFVMED